MAGPLSFEDTRIDGFDGAPTYLRAAYSVGNNLA